MSALRQGLLEQFILTLTHNFPLTAPVSLDLPEHSSMIPEGNRYAQPIIRYAVAGLTERSHGPPPQIVPAYLLKEILSLSGEKTPPQELSDPPFQFKE